MARLRQFGHTTRRKQKKRKEKQVSKDRAMVAGDKGWASSAILWGI